MKEVCKITNIGSGLSIQDAGRAGWRRYGVPASGAMDPYSAALANELVGNTPSAPVLEIALQGTIIEMLTDSWVGITGASTCTSGSVWSANFFKKGQHIEFSDNAGGVWAYLSIPGGWYSEKWFGSTSTYTRADIGQKISKSSILKCGGSPIYTIDSCLKRRIVEPDSQRNFNKVPELRLLKGPQYDAFSDTEIGKMINLPWSISSVCDRTGYRLDGAAIHTEATIKSEAVLPGSIQIPPDGTPIVTLNDGPTVGGYPKLAILHPDDLSWFVQLKPQQAVDFIWVD